MTLTKDTLIKSLHDNLGFSMAKSGKLIESTLEMIKRILESGEDVLISGFGKFCVKDKNKRKGRNPATGNALILDARRVVTFKCSQVMRKKIDKKFAKARAKAGPAIRKRATTSSQKGRRK